MHTGTLHPTIHEADDFRGAPHGRQARARRQAPRRRGRRRACDMTPTNAQQRTMCSGRPISSSWNTADTAKTSVPAHMRGTPALSAGK